MTSPVVFTIGYEGRALDEFIEILRQNHVTEVIDVREAPVSRKKGFSKNQLAQALEEAGLKYHSVRALGTPREIRNTYRQDHDHASFMAAYLEFLESRQSELQELLDKAGEEQVCLLCYERDSADCHRSLITGRLKEMAEGGVEVVDL